MTKPKEYKIDDANITIEKLLNTGFSPVSWDYKIRKVLYKNDDVKTPYVILSVVITYNKDDGYIALPSVICNDGSTYAPFYNPDQWLNNLVCKKVITEYNKFMDELVKKEILVVVKKQRHRKSKKGTGKNGKN